MRQGHGAGRVGKLWKQNVAHEKEWKDREGAAGWFFMPLKLKYARRGKDREKGMAVEERKTEEDRQIASSKRRQGRWRTKGSEANKRPKVDADAGGERDTERQRERQRERTDP